MNQDILFSTSSNLGIVTLNRPTALNALTQDMINTLQETLHEWTDNPNIHAILLQAAGEKAFCAGGDIRRLYDAAKQQDDRIFEFFSQEYRLNHYLALMKKPQVSLLTGITMGGGVGISQLGGVRIATEKYLFAMPETGIGFFPDVGGSYFLPRLPHHVGFYLALTGARIHADAALELGLVDYLIDSQNLDAVKQVLLNFPWQDQRASLPAALAPYLRSPEASALSTEYPTIEACFQASTVEEIMTRLTAINTPFAQETIATLLKQSPTSLKVTLQQCRNGQHLDIGACLQMEYRMVQQFFKNPDLIEGIRAAIIDKDRNPRWQPPSLHEVSAETVAAYFASVQNELELG